MFYGSTTTLKERQELMNYAKKAINEVNVRGWTWLKLEEHYKELK